MEHTRNDRGPRPRICKTAVVLVGLLAPLLAVRAPLAGEPSIITVGTNGSVLLSIGGKRLCKLMPTAATTRWRFSEAVKAKGSGKDGLYFTLFSPPKVRGGLTFTKGDGGASMKWTFTGKKPVEFNTLAIGFKLAVADAAGGHWRADDAEGTFPQAFKATKLFGGDVSTLTITAADGRTFALRFPKPTRVGIEDGRRWGDKNFKVRFGKVFGALAQGEIYELSAAITVPGKVVYDTDDDVIIRAGKDWVILRPELEIKPGSALDLSTNGFTQGPCGSRGRVIATPDGHFAFAQDPARPRRFYGANLCFTSQYMPKKRVDTLLDRWLRMGYNTLRIHHYEFRLTEPFWRPGFDWDPKRLDQLCYLIAGCAKRGIWITLDLFVSRPIAPKQINLPNKKPYIRRNNLMDFQYYKALVLVYEPAYKDFIKFTRKLLDHVNPYTGRRLAEEPALAWISLINEGAPGNRIKALPQWKSAWNEWLNERYPDREALARALGNLQADEDPRAGSVDFPKGTVTEDTARGRVCQAFMAEVERTFIERARSFLRNELKCPALITNHNCGPNTIADQITREFFDYVDDHFYIDIPIFEKGYGLPSRCPNINPVRQDAPRCLDPVAIRLWGKPMAISEYNFSGPGRFRGVGPMMTGALAALQDWDVLWRFAYAHSDTEIFKPTSMDYFNLSRDPLSLAADRAAVMLFLRGDLKTAPHRVARVIAKEGQKAGGLKRALQLAWVTRMGTAVNTIPKDAVIVPLTSSEADIRDRLEKVGIAVETEKGVLRSETGELFLDRNRGVFRVDTPRTAGGCAGAGKVINAARAGVRIDGISAFATVFVTSLNRTPIRKSPRLLVTHLTDLQNTGIHYGESARQTLLKWGNLPYLVRNGKATVHIELEDPTAYTVWALSVGGRRLERVTASVNETTLTFVAKVRSAYGARMLYELTTDTVGADPGAAAFKISKTAGADILAFDTPFLFTYKSWKNTVKVENSSAIIKTKDSRGGGGYNFNNGLDLTNMSSRSPVLYVTIGNGNQAKSIKVLFRDGDGRHANFIYDLVGRKTGEHLCIFPRGDAPLSSPNEGKPLELSMIKQIQILGNWSGEAIDIRIDKLSLAPIEKGDDP